MPVCSVVESSCEGQNGRAKQLANLSPPYLPAAKGRKEWKLSTAFLWHLTENRRVDWGVSKMSVPCRVSGVFHRIGRSHNISVSKMSVPCRVVGVFQRMGHSHNISVTALDVLNRFRIKNIEVSNLQFLFKVLQSQ